MWHLSRVHLRQVGHPDIRFDPLELDLTHDGTPCDTVWWLENGGGKTSLLSLVFAVLRPASREFLGSRHSRYLSDYVTTGDVAHVVLEWQLPGGHLPGLGNDEKLITGLTMEWPDLRAQPGNSSGLVRTLWGFRATSQYGLDQLPFLDDNGRPRRARRFAEQLTRDLGPVATAQLHRPDANQASWHEWLTDKDLDPEVFRFQLAMNHDEGAIAEEFAFPSGDAFVEWALKVAADPDLPGRVARTLDAVGERIHQRPALNLELDLCAGAADRLDELATCHRQLSDATSDLTGLQIDASVLAHSIELAAEAASAAADAAAAEEKAAEQAENKANNDATRAQRLANRWRQLAAEAAERAAEQARQQARKRLDDAELDNDGWQAAELLHLQDRYRREHAQISDELERFEEGLAPLRQQIETSGAALAARAAHIAARIGQDLADATHEQEQLSLHDQQDRDEYRTLKAKAHTVQRRQTKVAVQLAVIEQTRTRAVADGLLGNDDDPGQAAEQARADTTQTYQDLTLAIEEADVAQGAVDDAETALAGLRTTMQATDVAARAAAARAADMEREAEILADDEQLIAATQQSPAQVWTQPSVTLDRLRAAADTARRVLVDATLHATELDRVLTSLENDGYAPPSADVTGALRTLRDAGIPAVAGYTYLAEAVAAERRADTLAAAPDVATGIVITAPDRLAQARQSLEGFVPSVPLTLATAEALTDPERAPARHVVPPDPAVYDRDAAHQLLERLGDDQERATTTISQARDRTAAAEAAAARFAGFHSRWPDPASVRNEAASTATAHEKAASRVTRAEEALEAATRQSTAATGKVRTFERAHEDRAAAQQRLDHLADVWAGQPDLAAQSRAIGEELQAIADRQDDLEQRRQERTGRQAQLAGDIQRLTSQRASIADQLTRLDLTPTDRDTVDDPGGALEGHERNLLQLRARLNEQRSEQGLSATLDQLNEKLADHAAQLADLPDNVVTRGRTLLDSPAGQTPASRRQASTAAATHQADCAIAVGEANQKLEAGQNRLTKAADLVVVDLPDGTVIPDSEADRLRHADQEAARSDELWKLRRKHGATRENATKRASESRRFTELYSQTASSLMVSLGTSEPSMPVAAYAGGPSEAATEAKEQQAAITTAREQVGTAAAARQDAHNRLQGFVRSARFLPLVGEDQPTSRVVARLTSDNVAVLAGDATDLQTELARRADGLRADLHDIDQHRRLLVEQLVGVAREALGLLRDIQTRSRMPEGLAGWSRRRFIEIQHDPVPDDQAALNDRIARVVDQLIASRTTPDGHQLLYRATRAAVGDQPFTVRIIKPHMDLRYDRVSITSLDGFSGGQKVTAAVALFTTMLNMRATARGKHGYRTTLLLDNPFGKSSADAFVHLQRQVADRLGIQLVFTTAVKDLAALSHFRRVIRLEHRRNRRSGSLHVVEQPASSRLVAAAVSRADEPGSPAA